MRCTYSDGRGERAGALPACRSVSQQSSMLPMMRTCFLVLCGIDGSGKSAALAEVCRLVPHITQTHWSQLIGTPTGARLHLHDPASHIWTLHSEARIEYLMDLAASEYRELIEPALRSQKHGGVVSDSYYFKNLAKEHVYGRVDVSKLQERLGRLPKPDVVIYLDIDPREVVKRRPRFTSYESFPGDPDSPLAFQAALKQRLERLLESYEVVRIDGSRGIESVAAELCSVLIRAVHRLTGSCEATT